MTDLEVLSNFTDKTLEGELPDEELGGLLVPPDLTESDGTRAEPMGLLDTTSGGLLNGHAWTMRGLKLSQRFKPMSKWSNVRPARSSSRPWSRAAYEEPFLDGGICMR